MSYGIQHKQYKTWLEVVTQSSDGTSRCKNAAREVGGIWLKTEQDCWQFIEENNVSRDYYKPRRYDYDQKELWFEENRKQLLKNGFKEYEGGVLRPDGSVLFEK